MMHDGEAAGTRCPAMEIEPEKFRPQYKVHKILGLGGWKLGLVKFPETTNFQALLQVPAFTSACQGATWTNL